jgi:para-aminobenzoate synthetase/4-amino-4-deoxychorismate lyase
LFCNVEGELTEGARSNVFLKLDGRWYTPPLSSGVLPGIMRTVLLADSAWNAEERRLFPDDLRRAQEIVVCNALRGALRVLGVLSENGK